MSVRKLVLKQYQGIVDRASGKVRGLPVPNEGWIRTVRKALGMSGAQLGRKLSVSRSNISNTEKAELSGSVTLKTMKQMAEAMDCQFVYAIVPEADMQSLIESRAIEKAKAIVERTGTHMALEAQPLSREYMEFEIKRLSEEMMRDRLSDLWNNK